MMNRPFSPSPAPPPVLDAVVIGAGQNGLAASFLLRRKGLRHLVLERGEVGAAWLGRWDSFQLNTPNRYIRLPDMVYDGDDPDGFADRETVARFFRRYAAEKDLPVLTGCTVTAARRVGLHWVVETTRGVFTARSLVVATGHYAAARIPPAAAGFPAAVQVLHSADYRNPQSLPPGAVLIVGGGQSGVQIAEDLNEAGRKVYLCVSARPCNYRRFRGHDFLHWWQISGIQHRSIDDHPTVIAGEPAAKRRLRQTDFPLVSGTGGGGRGHSISYRALWDSGIVLVGRFEGVADGIVRLRGDVRDSIAAAHAATRQLGRELAAIADRHGGSPAAPTEAPDTDWLPPTVIEAIDLAASGIATVILATGFQLGWPWLAVERLCDGMGYPLGDNGLHAAPGLYFLGLFGLQRLSSTSLSNGGRDAAVVVDDLAAYLAEWDRLDGPVAGAVAASGATARQVLVVLPTEQDGAMLPAVAGDGCRFHFAGDEGYRPDRPSPAFDAVAFARRCRLMVARFGIAGVVYTHPMAALVAAAVAEDCGLPGPSMEAAFLTARRAGAAAPDAAAAPPEVDLGSDDWRRIAWPGPAVLAPSFPGAADLAVPVADAAALAAAVACLREAARWWNAPYRMLARRFIDTIRHPLADRDLARLDTWHHGSRSYGVEGWSDRYGHPHLWAVTEVVGMPGEPWRLDRRILPARLSPRLKGRLAAAAFAVARRHRLRSTFWGLTAAVTADGALQVYDLCGHAQVSLAPLYEAIYGVSLYQAMLALALGEDAAVMAARPGQGRGVGALLAGPAAVGAEMAVVAATYDDLGRLAETVRATAGPTATLVATGPLRP